MRHNDMKRTVPFVFVIFLLLTTVSCASPPNWTGAETEAGEFVWKQSPGIRFYINIVLLGGLLISLAGLIVYRIIHPAEKDAFGKTHTAADQFKGLGCAS